MIKVNAVSKKFGETEAVKKVSFNIGRGETLVLIGPSGCGKTTLLKMINRLIEADSGTIEIDNADINKTDASILRKKIGYVIQQGGLFPHYTVRENISVVPRLLNWKPSVIHETIKNLLAQVRLPEEILNKYPHHLSGGQQQRVGLARALAADPDYLLMDEPFSALDAITRTSLREDFKNLEILKNKTIIMVTHDIAEAMELGDKICLMNQGEVAQFGSPMDILFRPVSSFVESFLADQRLELQLRMLKINDILPFLPNNRNSENTLLQIHAQSCLAEILELFSKGNERLCIVSDEVYYNVDATLVMTAFSEKVKILNG